MASWRAAQPSFPSLGEGVFGSTISAGLPQTQKGRTPSALCNLSPEPPNPGISHPMLPVQGALIFRCTWTFLHSCPQQTSQQSAALLPTKSQFLGMPCEVLPTSLPPENTAPSLSELWLQGPCPGPADCLPTVPLPPTPRPSLLTPSDRAYTGHLVLLRPSI